MIQEFKQFKATLRGPYRLLSNIVFKIEKQINEYMQLINYDKLIREPSTRNFIKRFIMNTYAGEERFDYKRRVYNRLELFYNKLAQEYRKLIKIYYELKTQQ